MRRMLIVSLLALIPLGCRTDPSAQREIALLRAEILDLEDQFYASQAQLQDCKGAAGSVDGEYYVPQHGDAQIIEGEYVEGYLDGGDYQQNCETCRPAGSDIPRGKINYDSNANTPDLTSPRSFSPGEGRSSRPDDIPQTPDARRNRVSPEVPSAGEGFEEISPNGSSFNKTGGNDSRIEIEFDDSYGVSAKSSQSLGEQLGQVETDSGYEVITQIAINHSLSGGQDLDGLPGHEGLVLLIQPQTQFGNVVQAPGKLTISLMEAGESPSRQRIGIWRFTPNEVRNFFVKQEYSERGILLHLPWDRVTPKDRKLEVLVRYTTRDNRQLETSTEIEIEPPTDGYSPSDALITAWVERDNRWQDISSSPQPYTTDQREPDDRFSEVNPVFRATPVKTDRSIALPQWRPVR